MSVRRKLILAFAVIIAVMSLAFILLTHFVVKASLSYIKVADRSPELEELAAVFADYYIRQGGSWSGLSEEPAIGRIAADDQAAVSILLLSRDGDPLYSYGQADREAITALGLSRKITVDGRTVAVLHYHDPEAANLAKIQLGISSSVTVLLTAGALLLGIASLAAAFRLSGRLTRPLRELVLAIERLGSGERGVHARIVSRDEYGKVAGAFNAMSDRLLQGEEARRNLVADVAHELRTPIAILRGKLDLLQQSGGTIEPQHLLPLQDELIRLTRLVDDLHQLSLAEASMLPLEPRLTDLAGLLRRIADKLEADAGSKGIGLVLDTRAQDTAIVIDANRTAQIFLNLLTNAIKYTPENGSVSVLIEEDTAPGPDCGRMLRVTVTDSGPGIEAEHLPFLFDRFYRTDEARNRHSGGAGLGLAIAKAYVQAQGGTIEVRSEPGQGASFIVRLPAGMTTPSAARSAQA